MWVVGGDGDGWGGEVRRKGRLHGGLRVNTDTDTQNGLKEVNTAKSTHTRGKRMGQMQIWRWKKMSVA